MSERIDTDAEKTLPPEIQKYICRAAGGVKSHRRRQEVERELNSHAFDVLDELRSSGKNDQDAASEVVRRLGDVMNLNVLLDEANRSPMQRWIMRASAALLLLLTVGMTGALIVRTVDLMDRQKEFSKAVRDKYPAYVKAQNEESWKPIYALPSGQRDAGEILNDLLRWENSESSAPSLGLSKDLSDRVQKVFLKDVDLKKLKKVDLSGLDLSWMARLKDYDYWEVYSIGKGKKALEESLAEHRFMPKAPAIMDLMTLARARFIQGVQTGKIREALSEIENLGRLMMTSEILLPYMIGLSFYYGSLPQYEGLAFKAGILSGPARYHAVEDRDVRMASQTLYFLLSNYFTDELYLEEYLQHPEWKVGRCAAINDMLYSMYATDAYFSQRPWPFERDFSKAIDLRQRILEQSNDKCRLVWHRAGGFQDARFSISDFSIQGGNAFVNLLMRATAQFPYARRIVGLSINGVLTGTP
jgi:hypothetical protein